MSFFALATALILLSGEKNFLDVAKIHDALPILGACQTVLASWINSGDTLLLLFVTALIFNDVVNTSEAIERREFDYTHASAPPIALFFYCVSVILWNRCSKALLV